MNQPPKPEPPRAYVVREDESFVSGYINHDGSIEWVPLTLWQRVSRALRFCFYVLPLIITATILLIATIWFSANAKGAEATDIRTIDGDTFSASIDLGFGVVLKEQTVRLYGFDAWENSKHRRTLKLNASEWENELRKGENAYRALNGILKTAKKVEVRETQRGATLGGDCCWTCGLTASMWATFLGRAGTSAAGV